MAFQLVPVGRPTSAEVEHPPYAEAVRHAIRRGHGEFDWVILGETSVLLSPEKLQVLADCDRELLAAAAERDGAVALLTGPRSKVNRVFVSPNLRPAFGGPETLSVARDRELPQLLRAIGGHQPIALRLSLDAASDRPRPSPRLDPLLHPRSPPRPPTPPTTTWSAGSGTCSRRSSPSFSPNSGRGDHRRPKRRRIASPAEATARRAKAVGSGVGEGGPSATGESR